MKLEKIRIGFVCRHAVSSQGPRRFFDLFLERQGLLERFETVDLGIVLPNYESEANKCDALVSFVGIEQNGLEVYNREHPNAPRSEPIPFNPNPKKTKSFLFLPPVFYGNRFDPRQIVKELEK